MLILGSAPAQEHIIRIDVPNHDAVYTLQHQMDLAIIDAGANAITAYADDARVGQLRNLGYSVTILVDDYQTLTAPLGIYATYAEVCSTMAALAQQYSSIAKLETLGVSMGGRAILIMKVTANPAQEANRPRIRLNGPHHGNEKIATEITLAFLKYLCERYDTNAFVHSLVDTREIWIDPIFNVDGHVANRRTNNNGVDINRDFGYEWGGEGGSAGPYSQVETRAMREHSERHVINLEYNYHSTAAYVNYLWDNHESQSPDSSWVQPMSQRYADSTHGSGTQLDTINGYAWYEVHGSTQDNTYGNYGGMAWTIETDLPSGRPAVDNICTANRRALLDMIHLSGWGIQGLVCDSLTGAPLFAQVAFTEPYRWTTFTQYNVGDFHKSLPPGTYTVKVSSNGYVPVTLSNVVVPETGAVSLHVPMTRPEVEQPNYVQKSAIVIREDLGHTYTDWVIRALGEPDGNYYSVGPNPGYVVFDVDPFVPARNRVGNDISVYATGSYTLAASNNWQGPWLSLGSGTGNASFDLAPSGLDSARYLKVTGVSSARIDAIGYLGQPLTAIEAPGLARQLTVFRASPNPAGRQAVIELGLAAAVTAEVAVRDVAGRAVRILASRAELSGHPKFTWDLRDDAGQRVPNGVYFCAVSAGSGSASRKIVVER
jgi:carboxypeptidase T